MNTLILLFTIALILIKILIQLFQRFTNLNFKLTAANNIVHKLKVFRFKIVRAILEKTVAYTI